MSSTFVFDRYYYVDSNYFLVDSFEEADILSILRNTKPKMTTGSDGIPVFILHESAPVLAYPVTLIFNCCFKASCFYSIWNHSKVCPVYKKGHK